MPTIEVTDEQYLLIQKALRNRAEQAFRRWTAAHYAGHTARRDRWMEREREATALAEALDHRRLTRSTR